MHPYLNIATKAALRAANIITRGLETLDSITIEEKQANDLVTEIDRQSEAIIIDTLRQSFPEHGFLGEETGEHAGNDNTWIIDPLDGTRNFCHGFPHFCISIAMQHKDRIEHGLIYDPLRQELFTASRGAGARLNDRRIRVSKQTTLENSLLGTGFPFQKRDLIQPYFKTFENLFPKAGGVRRAGAAALDLAYVASGRLDGFWEFKLNKWDIAAGVLLVKEAGGLVGDFEGGENYMESGNIVAGNPKVFKAILQGLKQSLT